MNRQNFNQSEGFPFETENLNDMQTAYNLFNYLGNIAGNYAIISGCEIFSGVVSDGVVQINNETLEFRGGIEADKVVIVEEITQKEFEDGSNKNVLFVRYATFGIGAVMFNWSDFKRPKTTIQLTEQKAEQALIDTLITRIEQLESRPVANVPKGMIAIWSRPANEIPSGWIEYVDLRGRMPIGLDPNDGDLDALGVSGGEKQVTITREFLPNEKLSVNLPSNSNGTSGNNGLQFSGSNNANVTLETQQLGSGNPLSLMNPYRVVHFIQYIG